MLSFFDKCRAVAVTIVVGFRLHFSRLSREYAAFLIALCIVAFGFYWYLVRPPAHFPSDIIITVPAGTSVAGIAQLLAGNGVIAHPQLFSLFVRISGQARNLHAEDYRFSTPEGLLTVAYRLAVGDSGLTPVRVTLLEGTTAREMGLVLEKSFPKISAIGFRSAGEPYEGYLFPDTYVFLPNVTADTVVSTMRDNFDTRIASTTAQITASGHSLTDIVIMASLLEREAKTLPDKQMVAGILWNRIKLGMPLQVDAVFGYIHDRETYSPSLADLQVDSPYNTYLNKGLPPGPIDNPGLESIEAAATPTKTSDLYYLTGTDGEMHYAKTLAEHDKNRALYLNQ